MKATLKVEGMMCAHCENRVVQACKTLAGINEIQASAENRSLTCDFDETKVSLDQIKQVIDEIGYDVID